MKHTAHTTKDTARIYWQHMRRYRLTLTLALTGLVGAVGFGLWVPIWYKRLFDMLTASGQKPSLEALTAIILAIVAIEVVVWAGWRVATFSANRFFAPVMRDLHLTCFTHLHGHSYAFFQNNFAGSLVRKVNRFVRAFEEILDQIYWGLAPTILRLAVIIVVLALWYPTIALITAVWAALYGSLNVWYSLYTMKYNTARAAADTETTGRLADTVTNNANMKLFGGFAREVEAFKGLAEKLRNARRIAWDLGAVSETVQHGLATALSIGVLYMSIRMWLAGQLTIGDLVLIRAYLSEVFSNLWNVGKNIRHMYEGFADAAEMTEILQTPHGVADAANAAALSVPRGEITFRNIAFSYTEKLSPVFSDFSLAIAPGERVAFVGPSGGGKSTIVKLLLRFFDVQSGIILIDGQNIARVSQEGLRHTLALVPQDPILFHRTLMENIRYARPEATDAQVLAASRLAHCHTFISAYPDRYDTYVGERGVKLSGGERQRVAIARAILKNAPILVLDEATSSLDSESELLIQDALKTLMKGRTVIVIAHRLSTIMQMDRIIVIDGGNIIEEGKHKELVKASQGVYQKLWNIQVGGFSADEPITLTRSIRDFDS